MAETVDAVVVGAGVVGLAVAAALAQAGREVVILEAESAFGTGVSARNSEVLHAGLYYPTGSRKAQWCVEGRRLLLDFCRSHGVPFQLCGKLVVAVEEAETATIAALGAQAQANGVEQTQWLTGAQARALEPALHAVAALHSPGTGVVDSHALMTALLGRAQSHGAQLALCSPVVGGGLLEDGGVELAVGGAEPLRIRARTVVNAAGLCAPAVARAVLASAGPGPWEPPQEHFCRGHYFSLSGRSPFTRLIYPVHSPAGLGTHLTLDLAGQARFGPDVDWLPAHPQAAAPNAATPPAAATAPPPPTPQALGLDYAVDPQRRDRFVADIRRYWPGLPAQALQPAYTGIRPKIAGPGEPAADFCLHGASLHGHQGWVGLYGIESPGLTSCLAIARAVLEEVRLNEP